MPGYERKGGPPAGWTRRGDKAHCLQCRRAIAAEAANETAPEGATREERAKLRAQALIEFEIRRDPDRPNGEIAKVVRCSVPAVMKARHRIEPEPKLGHGREDQQAALVGRRRGRDDAVAPGPLRLVQRRVGLLEDSRVVEPFPVAGRADAEAHRHP